jgi:hypothetical protein
MPDLRNLIHSVIETNAQAAKYNRGKAENLEHAKSLRFEWAENRDTLYKFKSLSGDGDGRIVHRLRHRACVAQPMSSP